MLGVRFLDVDFMRINLACGCLAVKLIHLFCTVRCMERIAIAMQDGGAGAAAQHGGAGARGQPHFCLATERLCGAPGRGDCLVSNFHRGPGDACRHLPTGMKNIARPIPRSSSRAPAIFTRGQRPREDSLGFEKDKSAVALKFNFSKSGEHLVKYQLKPRRMKTDLEILGLHA